MAGNAPGLRQRTPASLQRFYAIRLFTPIVRPGRGALVRQRRGAKPRFSHLQEYTTSLSVRAVLAQARHSSANSRYCFANTMRPWVHSVL
jgi:hypothetical protein